MKRANATLLAAFFYLDPSITQKALLVSIPPLAGAFFRSILGYLSDQYGAKRVGFVTLGTPALLRSILITLRGRVLTATPLRRGATSHSFGSAES